MTALLILALMALGAFGYLVYRHGWSAAVAGIVTAAAGVWAALSGLFDMFAG